MGIKKVSNPPNPFHGSQLEWIDADPVRVEVYEERAKSIISSNDSPDVGFNYSINPYRGCFHACSYCYARPSHQYLDYGAGTDFQSRIVVKVNAVELLRKEMMKKSWCGDLIMFSGVTDCYQPLELSYEVTRGCLEVCEEFQNPVGIITKGAIIRRDIDLLSELARKAWVRVFFSIGFSDDQMSKKFEPGAPRPSKRFSVMSELARAGIPVGVAVAPVIPGMNDSQVPAVLERAADSGAKKAFMCLLRVPDGVKEVFSESLNQFSPEHKRKVVNRVKELRGETMDKRTEWVQKENARLDALGYLFESACDRVGINAGGRDEIPKTFQRPGEQLGLFKN